MHCLKCGREIKATEVFCPECLAEGSRYPVSRETPVSIPPRPVYDPDRQGRRQPKPEELLAQAKRRQRRWMRTALALGLACVPWLWPCSFSSGTPPESGQSVRTTSPT